MAAEHQPEDPQISSAPPPGSAAAVPSRDPSPIDNPATTIAANPPKRQRRPSVRLGEIGGGSNRSLRSPRDPSAAKTSKTRPLTNLVNGGADSNYHQDADNSVDLSLRRPKPRRPAKRPRTNWTKFDSNAPINGGNAAINETADFPQHENNGEFRELDADDSETPMLRDQQSPIHSAENMGLLYWDQQRRESRARVTGSNALHHNEINSPNEANLGVRDWLIGLGLGKYAPVFEIHEVDEEVLPMLTLEDLKDMGIAAVGSRRKIFLAINKLRKGFS